MGIPFNLPMGFLFTVTMGILLTIGLAIQLTISKSVKYLGKAPRQQSTRNLRAFPKWSEDMILLL
jgi:hypothetical protein